MQSQGDQSCLLASSSQRTLTDHVLYGDRTVLGTESQHVHGQPGTMSEPSTDLPDIFGRVGRGKREKFGRRDLVRNKIILLL